MDFTKYGKLCCVYTCNRVYHMYHVKPISIKKKSRKKKQEQDENTRNVYLLFNVYIQYLNILVSFLFYHDNEPLVRVSLVPDNKR